MPDSTAQEFIDKLSWNGPSSSDGRFLSIFMDQNNRCNLRCRMCGFSDDRVGALPRYDMPRALFRRLADDVFPRTNYLCLSIMTEPFMTVDFPDRLSIVREHGVPFSEIITNGTLLNERVLGQVFDAAISRFTFSIDGGTAEVFEAIRVGARFDRVLSAISLFQRMNHDRGGAMRLRINHVLSEENIDTFDAFLELLARIMPHEVTVRTVSRMSNAKIQERTDAAFWSKVERACVSLRKTCCASGIEDSGFLRDRAGIIEILTASGQRMSCRRPWDTIAIHANGDVYPCMAWSRPAIGSFVNQSFDEMWEGEALTALRREFEANQPGVDCHNCTVRRDAAADVDDDFFFRKLAAPAPLIA